MSMFGPTMGSWWYRSKSDPRWNLNGRCRMFVMAGPPADANERIEELKKLLKCDPPEDLEFGCMKD